MTKTNRFQKRLFGNSATYTCGACGKLTRETGQGEASCTLCAFCYLESGLENAYSDCDKANNEEIEQIVAELQALETRYKRKSSVLISIWAAQAERATAQLKS